jgi:hypothetical protein
MRTGFLWALIAARGLIVVRLFLATALFAGADRQSVESDTYDPHALVLADEHGDERLRPARRFPPPYWQPTR